MSGAFYSYTANELADILEDDNHIDMHSGEQDFKTIITALRAYGPHGPNDEQSACMDVLERLVAEAEHSMKSGEAFSRPNLLKSAKDVLAKVKP